MKQLIIVIASLLSCVFFVSLASAQECPVGTRLVIDAQTNSAFCLGTAINPASEQTTNQSNLQNDPQVQNSLTPNTIRDTSEYSEDLSAQSIKEAIRASGWELNIGIGYAMVASFDMRLTGGYHIGVDSLDGLSFGLYGEFSGQLGFPMSLAFDVVPMMHVHGESFRVSFGFGLGVFYISSSDYSFGTTLFEMRPEIRFDWFLSEHILIGVEASVPLLLANKNDSRDYRFIEPWFMFDIYFGYRF